MLATHRLLLCVIERVGILADDFAFDLVGPASVVSQAARAHVDVDLGHGEGLAIVQGLDGRQRVDVGLEQIGQFDQEPSSGLGQGIFPRGLERFAGDFDGHVDIFLGGLVNSHDRFLGGRVDGLKRLSLYPFHEFAIDEPA